MKKYIKTALVLLAVTMCFTGCGGDKDKDKQPNNMQVEETGEDISEQLKELEVKIGELETRAEELHKDGKIDDELYNKVMSLRKNFEQIGNKGTQENMVRYNTLTNHVKDLTFSLDGAEDPVETDNKSALESLKKCLDDVEPTLISAKDRGVFPADRMEVFNGYKAEVQGYIDGTKPMDEKTTERLAAIRSDVTTMATQAEASNTTIDKLNAEPVTVEDNLKLEELVSSYLDLQDEVQAKVNSKELPEEKLTELMTTGVKVVQVKEALRTGEVTQETKATMEECKTKLKAFAEGIGSDLAQNFS